MDFDINKINNIKNVIIVVGAGIIISGMTTIMLAFAWTRMINAFTDEKIDFKSGIAVYSKANLGKYLPGNIMHYIERNIYISKYFFI